MSSTELFHLTIAIENYIQPKLYTCDLCPNIATYRLRKACEGGGIRQKIGQFYTQKCPGNYFKNLDYLLEWYTRWKRLSSLDDSPAKLIDIFYFIDNRLEEFKEKKQKELEIKQKKVSRGGNPRSHRRR